MNKKINILSIISASTIGGSEKNLLNYMDFSNKDNFNLFVGSFRFGGLVENEVKARGIQFASFRDILSLYKFLKYKKIHIAQIYGLRASILARPICKLAGSRVIGRIVSVDSWRKWYHVLLDRLTSLWVDVWISNSYAGKEISIKREKFPADKIIVIHNGIDLSKYKRIPDDDIGRLKKHYGIKDNDMVIGEVANLKSMKGHVDIINAIPTIVEKYENVKFFFAGEDASNGEIERYAKEKNIDKYIIFAGFCSNIPEILSLFDIFILPSLWEGLPTAIIEAMAMGLPIIASKVGGIPELIDNGENGILIEPRSPQQIASSITYLLENQDIAKMMGEKNIIRVRKNHDIKIKALEFESVYITLV